MSIPSESGEELRSKIGELGRVLTWHATNTPASVWARAADEGFTARQIWPSKMFHWLFRNRPKRSATAEEYRAIMELLRGHTLLEEVFNDMISDPEWAIFSLSQIEDIVRDEEANII